MKSLAISACLILITIFPIFNLHAQSEEESSKQSIETLNFNRDEWVPSLLSAGTSAIYNLSQYNGYVFNWIPRGQLSNRMSYIDGINWSSRLAGWDANFSYAGLYKIFHQEYVATDYEYSSEGFVHEASVTYKSASTIGLKQSLVIGSRLSNSTFINEGTIQYSTGPLLKNWSCNVYGNFQRTPLGSLSNGFKKINGIAFSIDKILNHAQTIGLVFWWANSAQGKIAPAVDEVFLLSKQRNYNPSWGWYKGHAFYPNNKESHVPVFSLNYTKRLTRGGLFQIHFGLARGTQNKSQLDWTKTIDPRPDYYKYLPSYSKDLQIKSQLSDWYESNPQALQIDFDHLSSINQASTSNRSFYIINTQVSNVTLVKNALTYQVDLNENWNAQVGIHFSRDKIRYYNKLNDLLGGSYFLNYNGWVDDNGAVNNFQNDISMPDRKIIVGEKWGSDYILENIHSNFWAQVKKMAQKSEWSMSFSLTDSRFNRVGYNQNGLFPLNSLGKSAWLSFPAHGVKIQYLYKYSGRLYARAILYNQFLTPNAASVYLDPAVHSFTSSFLLPTLQQGFDASIFYRGVYTKLKLSAYWQRVQNESEKRLFYHDAYFAFVYGMLGQMESVFKGIEASIETEIASVIQLSATSTLGRYRISNNPLYEIRLANDLYKVETGLLILKNLPASTSPQIVQAISLFYQPDYSIRLGITVVYTAQRSIDYNYFRRTNSLMNKVSNNMAWNAIQSSKFLKDQYVFNVVLSKNVTMKMKNRVVQIRGSFSLKNLFNTLIPILAFEQSRFDYISYRIDKFPLKYLYDQGVTYTAGVQFQIQK